MIIRDRVRRAVAQAPVWALLLFGLSGALLLVARIAADFPKLGDAGYGDSYILYDVERFRRTGVIHRDPDLPPYPSALYSPLLYVALAAPGHILETNNPFLGPRVVVLLGFMACVAVTGSIARALIPVRGARAWGLLLASAISVMPPWALQLRADFPGAAFALLSVRLLLASGRWAALMAGMAAGLAFQFKITFVAALAAGAVWLLWLRRWRDLAHFTAAGAFIGVGPYLYFQLREPQTIAQMLIGGGSIIRDYGGMARLALTSVREPVCLLALAALPLVLRREQSRWWLLLGYAAMSLGAAAVSLTHAGGNINYFFEGLFAVTPLAALGALRLVGGGVTTGLLVAGLLVAYGVSPNVTAAEDIVTDRMTPASRLAERRPVEMMLRTLPGHRVLSIVPRIAILTDEPVITEPYHMAYMHMQGRLDIGPLLIRVRRQEFEVVVTPHNSQEQYRGVPMVPPALWSAIREAYQPFCAPGPNLVVYVPRGDGHGLVVQKKLTELGCTPVPNGPTRLSGSV